MKKLYSLTIRGRHKLWAFDVLVDPRYVLEWRLDGLQIDEVVNIIPEWYVEAGLPVRLWCFIQDLLNLKNPFAG